MPAATVEATQYRLESRYNSCDVKHESRGWVIVSGGRYVSRSNAPFDTDKEAIARAKQWLQLQDAASQSRQTAIDYERKAAALFEGSS